MEEPHLCLSFTLYLSPHSHYLLYNFPAYFYYSHINIVPNYLGVSQWMR